MSDPFSEEPPQWLQRETAVDWDKEGEKVGGSLGTIMSGFIRAGTNDEKNTGMNFLQAFGTGMNDAQDSMYEIKRNSALLSIESQKTKNQLQNFEVQDQIQGAKEIPEWMKQTGGDWKKILDTPFTGTSQAGGVGTPGRLSSRWGQGRRTW